MLSAVEILPLWSSRAHELGPLRQIHLAFDAAQLDRGIAKRRRLFENPRPWPLRAAERREADRETGWPLAGAQDRRVPRRLPRGRPGSHDGKWRSCGSRIAPEEPAARACESAVSGFSRTRLRPNIAPRCILLPYDQTGTSLGRGVWSSPPQRPRAQSPRKSRASGTSSCSSNRSPGIRAHAEAGWREAHRHLRRAKCGPSALEGEIKEKKIAFAVTFNAEGRRRRACSKGPSMAPR